MILKIFNQFSQFWNKLWKAFIGLPEYQVYLEHMQKNHPEQNILSPEDFFKESLERKYGKGSSRCC